MGLSDFDRDLLDKCLKIKPGSWEHFTDRFAGLLMGVVTHVANAREIRTSIMDREDIVAKVFETLIEDDFRVLRNFKGNSSLYTYLTVVCRRIAVRQLIKLDRKQRKEINAADKEIETSPPFDVSRKDFEELLVTLDDISSELVRLRYVDDLPYSEISRRLNIPENSIGPMLSRARATIRQAIAEADQ